jgi:GT2 family glycosyltransferase
MGEISEESPRVAVVICTRDRPTMLAAALDAIVGSVRPGDEIVVVDSASRTPETAATARRRGLRVERAELPGASRARNLGAAASTAPLILFTDDDCIVAPSWVTDMAAAFDADPALAFAFGRVVSDREAGPAVALFTDDESRRYSGAHDPLSMGHAANLAIRRPLFERIAGFDPELGAGARFRACEDKDLFWRALSEGGTGAYVPEAVVVHRQWRSRRAMIRLRFDYGVGSGAFAVKMRRRDKAAGRALLLRVVLSDGVLRAVRELIAGRRAVAAGLVAKAMGALSGAGAAVVRRVWL